MLTHGNLLASAEAVRLAWRWTDADRLVLALPLFHLHGLGVGLHGTLAGGRVRRAPARFDPDAVLDAAAAARRPRCSSGCPPCTPGWPPPPGVGELSRLRLCVSGSAPLPPAVFDAIEAGCRPAGARALRHDRDGA